MSASADEVTITLSRGEAEKLIMALGTAAGAIRRDGGTATSVFALVNLIGPQCWPEFIPYELEAPARRAS